MRAILLATASAVALSNVASAIEPKQYAADEGSVDGAYTFYWPGSAHALSINTPDLPAGALIEQALAMEAVQSAVADFLARGYVRRADLDHGVSLSMAAAVALAFEKPGAPLDEAQPVLLITSRRVGDFAATQVFGGVLGSAGGDLASVQAAQGAADPAVDIAGHPESVAGELAAEDMMGVHLAYATHYDPVHTWGSGGSGWRYVVCRSTGVSPSKWSQYASTLGNAAQIGLLNGLKKGVPTNAQGLRELGFGLVVAEYAAHTAFWAMSDSGC